MKCQYGLVMKSISEDNKNYLLMYSFLFFIFILGIADGIVNFLTVA